MSDRVAAINVWDRNAFQTINEGLKSPALDAVMPHISDLGLGHVQVLLILALGICAAAVRGQIALRSFPRDAWRAVATQRWVHTLLLAFAIGGIGSLVSKAEIIRDRPYWFYHHEHEAGRALWIHVELATGRTPLKTRGFVSGHSATSFAIMTAATGLFWRRRRAWSGLVGGWVLAGLIGLSRIYIGDHWPLDVMCGAVLGLAGGLAALVLMRRVRRRDELRAAPPVPSAQDAAHG